MFSWLKKRSKRRSVGPVCNDNQNVLSRVHGYFTKANTITEHIYEAVQMNTVTQHIYEGVKSVGELDNDVQINDYHFCEQPFSTKSAINSADSDFGTGHSTDGLITGYVYTCDLRQVFRNGRRKGQSCDSGFDSGQSSECDLTFRHPFVSDTETVNDIKRINGIRIKGGHSQNHGLNVRQSSLQELSTASLNTTNLKCSSSCPPKCKYNHNFEANRRITFAKYRRNKCRKWFSNQWSNLMRCSQPTQEPHVSLEFHRSTNFQHMNQAQSVRRRLMFEKLDDHNVDCGNDSWGSITRLRISAEQSDWSHSNHRCTVSLNVDSRTPCLHSPGNTSDFKACWQAQNDFNELDNKLQYDELVSFNPRYGFGLNKWYTPSYKKHK